MTLKEIAGDPRLIQAVIAFTIAVQTKHKNDVQITLGEAFLATIGELTQEVARRNCEVCNGLD